MIQSGKSCLYYLTLALAPSPCSHPAMSPVVSRYNVKDSSRHVILGTQQFKPVEFGQQINLSMDNAWGIVR